MRAFHVLLAVVLGLVPSLASAAPRVLAAEHEASLAGDTITWRSRALVSCDGFPTVRLRDGEAETSCGRELHEVTMETLDRGKPILHPPLFAGDAVQVVLVHAAGDERVEPSAGVLERHVGYWRGADVTDEDRHDAMTKLGRGDPHPGEVPWFLAGTSRGIATRGVPVLVTTGAQRRGPAVAVIAVLSALLVLVLAWLYRRLSREVEIERAEAALKREFEGLEGR